MFLVVVVSILFNLHCVSADIVETDNYVMYAARAGVGDIVGEVSDVSLLSCGYECSSTADCNSANYEPTNHTCTLLHVYEVHDDWLDSQENIYMCANYAVDFTASVGFWPFIDDTSNLRDESAVVTGYNTPFVPAVPGGSTNVIAFLGDKDSYVLLENNGDLAVTSFTWTAKVYPESDENEPLFNWYLPDVDTCAYHGPHIWLVKGSLLFSVCVGSKLPNARHTTVMALNAWHDLAVSYDVTTGAVQLRTNDTTENFNVGQMGSGHTAGPVVIGSRYYHSGTRLDTRVFQGKMACVRLWKGSRNLDTLRMDSPLCQINA